MRFRNPKIAARRACVYAHYKIGSEYPFYISCSINPNLRPYQKGDRSKPWKKESAGGYRVVIIKRNMNLFNALKFECELIIKYHPHLVNGGLYKDDRHRPEIVERKRQRLDEYQKQINRIK